MHIRLEVQVLGAFIKLRKAAVTFAMSVRLHRTIRISQVGFSWNFNWGISWNFV